ncbi:hypothetical protein YC2023_115976 [Brassica napus]
MIDTDRNHQQSSTTDPPSSLSSSPLLRDRGSIETHHRSSFLKKDDDSLSSRRLLGRKVEGDVNKPTGLRSTVNHFLSLGNYETKKSEDLVSVIRAREVTRWCRYSRAVTRFDVGLAREVTGVIVGFAREVTRWWCICVPEMVLSRYGFVCVVCFVTRLFCIKKTKSVCVFCVTRWCLSNSLYQVIKTHISLALYKSSHCSYQVIKTHIKSSKLISLFLSSSNLLDYHKAKILLITTNPNSSSHHTNPFFLLLISLITTNPFYKT